MDLWGKKKEAFRRGEEGFFVFRGLSWSQGPKRSEVFRSAIPSGAGVNPRRRRTRAYFFFFVVFFEEDFFAVLFFFVAMALVPPFSAAQSKEP